MSNSSIAIQALRLSKRINGRHVLRGIDLAIAPGQCVALMGCNGAGKTTLLRCLAAIIRPTRGEIRWFGRLAGEVPTQRKLIGMVCHNGGLYEQLTPRENLLFAARMGLLSQPKRRVELILEQTDLRSAVDLPVRQLSQGTRQRVALARALIHDPPILLLDEPFTGLDPSGHDWLTAFLRDHASRGRAVCFATHNQARARQLSDHTTILRDGMLEDTEINDGLMACAGYRGAA